MTYMVTRQDIINIHYTRKVKENYIFAKINELGINKSLSVRGIRRWKKLSREMRTRNHDTDRFLI